jgi:Lon protease-like protein
MFPLRTVLFPGHLLPLHIFEPRYRLLVSRCAEQEPSFGVVLTKSGREVGDQPETYEIGTSAVNVEHVSLPDGRSNLLVKGARRFQILESDWDQSYMTATIEWLDGEDATDAGNGTHEVVGRIENLLVRYLDAHDRATGQQARLRDLGEDPTAVAYAVASALPIPIEVRQRLLEADPPDELLSLLEETIRHETALLVKTGVGAFLPGIPGARFTNN